jgi:hypothetical protein
VNIVSTINATCNIAIEKVLFGILGVNYNIKNSFVVISIDLVVQYQLAKMTFAERVDKDVLQGYHCHKMIIFVKDYGFCL